MQLHSYSFHPPLQRTDRLGIHRPFLDFRFPLHLSGEDATFVTVSRTFSLEVFSSWGQGWSERAAASSGEGMRWLQEAVLGVHGLRFTQHHLPSTSLPHGGQCCYPTTIHPDQWSSTNSMELCDFRRVPLALPQASPRRPSASVQQQSMAHLAGAEGVMWHSSGAGEENSGSNPCPVLGWEAITGCCLSPVSQAVAFLQTILGL